jgi:hypothetical protein
MPTFGDKIMEQMRREWFAQLANAIDGAQRVAWQLGTSHGVSVEARELYGRLEAARLELESLRAIDARPLQADTDWLQKLGWTGILQDPAD